MNCKPKISVIVPVYKAEAYVHRCVDSLLTQTFQDFEILLVDDGSPDRSGEICDEYAKKDKRVRVFHKENGGVSTARNEGIKRALGEWIAFIDSDDYVDNTFLEDFGLEDFEADIFLSGYKKIEQETGNIEKHSFATNRIQRVSLTECFAEGEMKNILNSPVCKLFRHDIVMANNLQFDVNISFGEDHLFVLSYLYYVRSLVISSAMSYNYVRHGHESLTNRIIPLNDILYYTTKTYQFQTRLFNGYAPSVMKAICWRAYSNLVITLGNLIRSNNFSLEDCYAVKTAYKSLNWGYEGLSLHRKCFQYLFFHLPTYVSYNMLTYYAYTHRK